MNKFYVYIVQSDKDKTYIGQTKDLVDRLKRHNSNRSKFTSHKGTWEISEYITVDSRREAVALERKLKSFKNSKKAIQYLQKLALEHPDF